MKQNTIRKKVVIGIIIGLIVIIAGIYFGLAVYFSKHFYPNTSINGLVCGNMTAEEVKSQIQQNLLEYKLTLNERGDQQEVITAEQMGFKYVDDKKEVEGLLDAQQPYLWFIHIFTQEKYKMSVNTEHDEELVESALNNLNSFKEENQEAPKDAYMEENESGFVIVPEVNGTTLDKEKAKKAVLDAIYKGEEELSFEKADLYLKPTVFSDDQALNAQKESLNRLTTAEITYDFLDREMVVDRGTIKEFLDQDQSGNYTLNQEKVSHWVDEMARETDTFGLTHEFMTYAGDMITLEGGDYGWVIDIDQTTSDLMTALEAGTVEKREPAYIYTAMDRSTNDIGETYVEVSITEQRMWCYKDGELIVDTLVVTGNSSKGWDTPKGGVWAIDAKKRNAILKGEGYASPVDYWLPFNGDVGIHDLGRTEFGGEIYKTSGSHGCVNTPYDNAQTIYEAVEIGTPVIVY